MSEDILGHPVFEIMASGRHIKIYASGRVQGFEDESVNIINRIPILIARAGKQKRAADAAPLYPDATP